MSKPKIWVTRPEPQAAGLLQAIAAIGCEPLAFPLLDIQPVADRAPLRTALARLAYWDLAVFVSPSALDAVFAEVSQPWPESLPAAVMGPGSAQRAREYGIAQLVLPQRRFDSEALLELESLQNIAGWNIVLFCGQAGRETLPSVLRARGATVQQVVCYQRALPAQSAQRLTALFQQGCDGIILTSSEAARNLFALAGVEERERLQSALYFVPHQRIAEALRNAGAQQIVQTETGDMGIAASVRQHFCHNPE